MVQLVIGYIVSFLILDFVFLYVAHVLESFMGDDEDEK